MSIRIQSRLEDKTIKFVVIVDSEHSGGPQMIRLTLAETEQLHRLLGQHLRETEGNAA